MSLDELARGASRDLRSAVDHQISTEASRQSLSARVRSRRLEHGLVAVLVVLGALAGVSALGRFDLAAAPPAGPSPLDPTAAPAADCLFTMACRDGSYRAALSVPTTFRTADVATVSSDTPGRLDLTVEIGTFALVVMADPTPVGASPPTGRTARDLAQWLSRRTDVIGSGVSTAVLAGRQAYVVDVHARSDSRVDARCRDSDACIPLFGASGSPGGSTLGLDEHEMLRVFFVDVPDSGTVAVVVSDRSTAGYAPAPALGALRPVLDSLAFGAS
jgi:hypothetical protein